MSDNLSVFEKDTLSRKRTVELDFGPRVTRDELIASLDEILHLAGCTACGLQGIDIKFQGRIRLVDRFDKIPNVVGARITEVRPGVVEEPGGAGFEGPAGTPRIRR